MALSESQKKVIAKVRRSLEEQRADKFCLIKLARIFDYSPWHLQHLFRKETGMSPADYHGALRRGESPQGMPRHEERGPTIPTASYGRKGAGAVMRYGFASCPDHFEPGFVFLATTTQGLSFLGFEDDPGRAVKELHDEFPDATEIVQDHNATDPALEQMLAYLNGELSHPDFPLDVYGTAFQYRVWQALIAIPPGETRSYQDLANALGLPKGSRAAARGCATNPVSLTIPCHRIVGSSDKLTGYRWGVHRKRALLNHEAVAAS